MSRRSQAIALCFASASLLSGCGFWLDAGLPAEPDAGLDAFALDTGSLDTGALDVGSLDTGTRDVGPGMPDVGGVDATSIDVGRDTNACMFSADCMHVGDACHPGTCVAGVCMALPLDCTGLDTTCSVGVCTEGVCNTMPRPEPVACDDGDICSWADACGMGTCGGITTDCGLRSDAHFVASTPVHGTAAVANYIDDCPLGQVMIGIEASLSGGYYPSILRQYATLCGEVHVEVPPAGSPIVSITPGARVPATGGRGSWTTGDGGGPMTRTCMPNHVVVGIAGATSPRILGDVPFISQLRLRCAPLDAHVTGGVVRVTPGPLDPVGSDLGTRADFSFGATDCEVGMVAMGSTGYAGQILDSLALRCGPIALTNVTTAPSPGTAAPAAFRDDCPWGYVPVGVRAGLSGADIGSGLYDQNLTQLTTLCAPLTLSETSPDVWRGTVGTTRVELPTRGTRAVSSGSATQVCGANQAIVGYGGDGGTAMTRLVLRCAPVTATGALGALTFDHGAITALPPIGTRVTTPFGPTDCPPGMIGRGFFGSAGEVVDNLALRCSVPTFLRM